jgi:hypothetical protein
VQQMLVAGEFQLLSAIPALSMPFPDYFLPLAQALFQLQHGLIARNKRLQDLPATAAT